MKNYFFQLNRKYIQAFKTSVIDRFKNEDIKTDEVFLKSIFKGLTELFKHIGDRTTSKNDIPKYGEYPDAEKYNKLINALSDDIDKLYKGQSLIEDDLNNLLKFNAKQRTQTFENLVSVQQKIMELYIKNKKDISGEFVIENSFESSDKLGSDSSKVDIDEVRGTLTLQSALIENKPIDTSNVVIYFTGTLPDKQVYPSNKVFGIGSHWKINSLDTHFVNTDDPSALELYKNLMIDSGSNMGIGWTEFEAVSTELIGSYAPKEQAVHDFQAGGSSSVQNIPQILTSLTGDLHTLKTEVGNWINKDPELIYLDIPYSLQGKNGYVKRIMNRSLVTNQEEKYKVVIPFLPSAKLTNEIAITFAPIQGNIPKILYEESKIFSNSGGRELSYSLVPPSDTKLIADDNYYICKFNNYLVPYRLELILVYGGDGWHYTPFEMSHYIYSMNKTYKLSPIDQEDIEISILIEKNYNVFVDSEPNKNKEKERALGVLRGSNR